MDNTTKNKCPWKEASQRGETQNLVHRFLSNHWPTQELQCAGQDPKDPSGKEQHSLKSEAEISAASWCWEIELKILQVRLSAESSEEPHQRNKKHLPRLQDAP